MLLVGRIQPGSPASRLITGCRPVAKHRDADGVDNDEQGVVLSLCSLTRPWSQAWPVLRHYY